MMSRKQLILGTFGLVTLVLAIGQQVWAGQEQRPAFQPSTRAAILLQQQRQHQERPPLVSTSTPSPLFRNRLWQQRQQLQRPQGIQSYPYQASARSGYGSVLRQISARPYAPSLQPVGPAYTAVHEQRATTFAPTAAGRERIFGQNAQEISKLRSDTQSRIKALEAAPGYLATRQSQNVLKANRQLLKDLREAQQLSSPFSRVGLTPAEQKERLQELETKLGNLKEREFALERETAKVRSGQREKAQKWWQ